MGDDHERCRVVMGIDDLSRLGKSPAAKLRVVERALEHVPRLDRAERETRGVEAARDRSTSYTDGA